MAIIRLATAVASAMVDVVVDRIDADAGPGTLKVYSGAVPADGDTTPAGTLLATVTLADPAFGSASSISTALSRAVMVDPAATTWIANGTAGCFIIEDQSGDNVFAGDVTDSAGTGTLKLSSVTAVSGNAFDITAFNYDQPTGA